MEALKLSNANKFAELETNNDNLEKHQKEQQLNIVDLEKTVATLSEMNDLEIWAIWSPLKNCVFSIVVADLEAQKLSNANKFVEIEQKNDDKLEKPQKEQQLNSVDLQKKVATLREMVI
uniref:Uncharacterized protein n=1 Tax=Globodera pallida TaxID=36090 RepID=A0A183BR79_GLOPA